MKRALIFIVALAIVSIDAFPGGIMSNSNQSASYTQMTAREGVIDIDGVYYNPAGLTLLGKGLHFSLNNQFIFQTRDITTNYPYLNSGTYQGDLKVYFFPGIYAAYNFGKFSVSFGFNPVGGGGSATYETGLPSFEYSFSDIVPLSYNQVAPTGDTLHTSSYDINQSFEGSSVYLGYQLNFAYKINDMISVAAGLRYVSAEETYVGSINNILYETSVGYLSGYRLNPLLTDKEVDVVRTGSGVAPILSVNLQPIKNLNVSVKYEFNTSVDLENDTKVDSTGMFPDGEKISSDMPALLAFGASYKMFDKLLISGTYRTYFETAADWDGMEDSLDGNTYELALGLEYSLFKFLALRGGYQYGHVPENTAFNSDMKFHVPSSTFAFGLAVRPIKSLEINLGASYSMYTETTNSYTRHMAGNLLYPSVPVTETYNKETLSFGIGLNYNLGGKK
jgi:long-chain fatty acid transport protein